MLPVEGCFLLPYNDLCVAAIEVIRVGKTWTTRNKYQRVKQQGMPIPSIQWSVLRGYIDGGGKECIGRLR